MTLKDFETIFSVKCMIFSLTANFVIPYKIKQKNPPNERIFNEI